MATGGLAQLVLLFGGRGQDAVALLIGAGVAGQGTCCCCSLLVGLVRAYFGEDTAPVNFAATYSAKALGGVIGVGLASLVVVSHCYPSTFLTAAVPVRRWSGGSADGTGVHAGRRPCTRCRRRWPGA